MHEKSGIPRNAFILNLVLSMIFVFTLQSWHALVAALGMFFAVGYAIIAVASGANRKDPRLTARPWLKGLGWIAPLSFAISGLVMFWAGWNNVKIALILFAISIPIYLFLMMRDKEILTPKSFVTGLWFPAFMGFIGIMSFLGTFGGLGVIPMWWDTIITGVVSLAIYYWGYKSSVAWMNSPGADAAAGKYY